MTGNYFGYSKVVKSLTLAVVVIMALLAYGQYVRRDSSTSLGMTRRMLGQTDSCISLLAGGDVMLGRSVNAGMTAKRDDYWPWKNIADELMQADIALVNLESPLSDGCKVTHTGMVFCARPEMAKVMAGVGIDVVNLANNHIGNQGELGLMTTKSVLSENGVGTTGDGKVWYEDVRGVRVGIVGFDDVGPKVPGIDQANEVTIKARVEEAAASADVVMATFHWGNEYTTVISDRQRRWARMVIDRGADLVIGHHPHWVQGREVYKGKLIYYSLGNLVFDQMWSEGTKRGLLVKFEMCGEEIREKALLPVVITDYGQPRWTDIKERAEILSVF